MCLLHSSKLWVIKTDMNGTERGKLRRWAIALASVVCYNAMQAQVLHVFLNTNNCLQHAQHLGELDRLPDSFPIELHLQSTERKAAPLILKAMGFEGKRDVHVSFDRPEQFYAGLLPLSSSAVHVIMGSDTIRTEVLDSLGAVIDQLRVGDQARLSIESFSLADTIPFTRRISVANTGKGYCMLDKLLGKLIIIPYPDGPERGPDLHWSMQDVDSLWSLGWESAQRAFQIPEFCASIARPSATILSLVPSDKNGVIIAFSADFTHKDPKEPEDLQPRYRWLATLTHHLDGTNPMLKFVDLKPWVNDGYTSMIDVGSFMIKDDTLCTIAFRLSQSDTTGAFIGTMPYNQKNRSYDSVELFDHQYPSMLWDEGFRYMLHNGKFSGSCFFVGACPVFYDMESKSACDMAPLLGTSGPFFDYQRLRYFMFALDSEGDRYQLLSRLDDRTVFASFDLRDPVGSIRHASYDLSAINVDLFGTVVLRNGEVWGLDRSWSKLVRISGFR